MEGILRPAEIQLLVKSAIRTALDLSGNLRRALTGFGGDRDDAADRVAAVVAALRTAQYLDALNIAGQQLAEVELLIVAARIGDVDTVDQHLDMIGVGATNVHFGQGSRTASLSDI